MLKQPLIFLLLILSSPILAQEKSQDITAITTTIENYFDGY